MRLFVTGSTGMLGQEVVPYLLSHGHELVVLCRRPPPPVPGVIVVTGDITQTVPPQYLQGCDAVLHLAALTSLRQTRADEIWRVNALGTTNVLKAALAAGVSRFFHCSTIYISGDITTSFDEDDFGRKQWLRNPYEASKLAAEGLVRCAPLDVTIFRPAILLGRHSDGAASFLAGFYRPFKALAAVHRMAEATLGLPLREKLERGLHLPPLPLPLRVYGDPEARLPLAPVDWAAATIAGLVDRDARGVYHLVPKDPPTGTQLAEAVNRAFGCTGVHMALRSTHNPLDMVYNRLIRDFHPYVGPQPVIGTSIGHTCPPVDTSYLERVLRYWRTHYDTGRATGLPIARPGVSHAGQGPG